MRDDFSLNQILMWPSVASQSMDPDDQIMVLTANEHSLKPQMLGEDFERDQFVGLGWFFELHPALDLHKM